MAKKEVFWLLAIVLLVVSLPYLLAAALGGRYLFSGFLMNPLDGNSYLAKMYEGWNGSWRFTLPYTAEAGEGAYLFLLYLFLGHLARWFHLPIIWLYHLARLFGTVWLVLALAAFFRRVFPDQPHSARLATWLAALGSGMGWVVVLSGLLTSDFWVAETYPFLSAATNPHFPLGLACLLTIFTLDLADAPPRLRFPLLVVLGLLLSVLMQFGLVLAALVLAGRALWLWSKQRRLAWQSLFAILLLGGPFLLYQFWALQSDPVLAGWNVQNQTPSPALWDLILSLSPMLFLAGVGVWALWRGAATPGLILLTIWLGFGLALVYFPFALQRRFLLGLYIPLTGLAVYGLAALRQKGLRSRLVTPALFGLALPTNLLLLLLWIVGAVSHAPGLYLSGDEAQAMSWLRQETPAHALILASPELGNFIPAQTGRRVIYGHPFETVHALEEETQVNAFYGDGWTDAQTSGFLHQRGVDYVIVGNRERALGSLADLRGYPQVFQAGEVAIYSVKETP